MEKFMKKFLLTLMILVSSSGFLANAAKAEYFADVLNAEQVSATEIEITVFTNMACNDPELSLDYKFSAKAIFGPHYYDVKLTPRNRMLCKKADFVTARVKIPNQNPGSVLIIRGDNETSASVTLE